MRSLRNLFVLILSLASLASATVLQIYDSRANWEAATTGQANVDFAALGLAVGGYTSYSTSGGLSLGGLTFVGVESSGYWLYAVNPTAGSDQDFGSSTVIKTQYGASAYLAITLPSATTSFGVDLMTAFPDAQTFRIELDSVDLRVDLFSTAARPTRTFVGVTTDTAISQVRIYLTSGNSGTVALFDNFGYGAAGSSGGGGDPPGDTPEIATMLCVGSGLIAFRWARRRQVLTSAAAPA